MFSSYSVHEPIDLNDGGSPPHLNSTISGRYGVQKLLGVGRTSRVYQARIFPSGEEVAVKVLRENCNTREDLERLQWEGQVLSSLVDSGYFTRPIDIGISNQDAFLVTEPVRGQTLAAVLKTFGHLQFQDAIDVAIQLTEALQCLHDRQIIHGSFSTNDIILDATGPRFKVKVIDLDSAVQIGAVTPCAMVSEGVCFDYMSPEQTNGASVDVRTDVYIFGLIFYEMLTGRRPFYGSSPFELLNARFTTKPQSILSTVDGIECGDVVEGILGTALEADPAKRFGSVSEIRDTLLEIWKIHTGQPYCSAAVANLAGQSVCAEDPPSKPNLLEKIVNWFRGRG